MQEEQKEINMNQQERREYQESLNDASWFTWRVIWKAVGIVIVLGFVSFGIRMLFLPAALVTKVTDPDKIISNYEEFQEIYNTTSKLDADIYTICSTPNVDAMFSQFSKGAMIAAKRQQMTRWVNEYNAKSKMITRKYWKSSQLPYQLNEEEFPHYNCK